MDFPGAATSAEEATGAATGAGPGSRAPRGKYRLDGGPVGHLLIPDQVGGKYLLGGEHGPDGSLVVGSTLLTVSVEVILHVRM